jgi:hypothetical protein
MRKSGDIALWSFSPFRVLSIMDGWKPEQFVQKLTTFFSKDTITECGLQVLKEAILPTARRFELNGSFHPAICPWEVETMCRCGQPGHAQRSPLMPCHLESHHSWYIWCSFRRTRRTLTIPCLDRERKGRQGDLASSQRPISLYFWSYTSCKHLIRDPLWLGRLIPPHATQGGISIELQELTSPTNWHIDFTSDRPIAAFIVLPTFHLPKGTWSSAILFGNLSPEAFSSPACFRSIIQTFGFYFLSCFQIETLQKFGDSSFLSW